MQINIQTNFKDILGKLDEMQKDVATKAMASALNKTTELGKTEMSKQIRSEFNISAGDVRAKLQVRRATFSQGRFGLYAALLGISKKRGLNIARFAARQTKKGLTAKIKKSGGRVLVSGRGFLVGGKTAFKRVGKARLPIKPLTTIDVPGMFNTNRIKAKVTAYMLKRFPEVFEREAAFYVSRFNRS